MSKAGFCLVVLSSLTLTLGCGPKAPERPPVTPVSGVVTLNGEPLGGAVISFRPSNKGRGGSAISADDGTFEATSFSKGDGLLAGKYGITVTKYPVDTGSAGAAGDMDSDEYTGEDTAPEDPVNELPAQYEKTDTSGLSLTVEDGTPVTDFKIDLTE